MIARYLLRSMTGLALVTLAAVRFASGQEPQDEDASKQRLARMQRAIDAFQVRSPQIKSVSALKFASAPLLRYADQTRSLLDAGVWRMGQRGRPTAFATLETYLRDGIPH